MGCHVRNPCAGIALPAVLLLANLSLADSHPPPWSYKQVAPGERFVFVMISPLPVEEQTQYWREEKRKADIREVLRTYRRSGMYRNDGSTEPLWTVDWYSFAVEPTPDGMHLVRPGPWASLGADRVPDLDWEAVSFFVSGRLVRTYRIGELVDDVGSLKRSVSHFEWRQEGRLSGEDGYVISTLDGNRFEFDVRTGGIVSESRRVHAAAADWRDGWGWWATLGGVVVVAATLLAWRRRARTRLADPSAAPPPASV